DPVRGPQTVRQAQHDRPDGQPHAPIPPLARIPAEYRRQKTSCSAPVLASAPLSEGPSVRVRTVRVTRTASGIAAQLSNSQAVMEPSAHGSGALTNAPTNIAL